MRTLIEEVNELSTERRVFVQVHDVWHSLRLLDLCLAFFTRQYTHGTQLPLSLLLSKVRLTQTLVPRFLRSGWAHERTIQYKQTNV